LPLNQLFNDKIMTAESILTKRRFDRLARELFGSVLEPQGFSCDHSSRCTFTRKIDDEVYHVILPDPFIRTAYYDINVFPTSPRLQEDFEERFPDSLGFTLDVFGKLSETMGVGIEEQRFNCKYESNMRRGFEKTVSALLTDKALPFLDSIQNFDDMLPRLRGPFARFQNT